MNNAHYAEWTPNCRDSKMIASAADAIGTGCAGSVQRETTMIDDGVSRMRSA
jgi:hypothetical protein